MHDYLIARENNQIQIFQDEEKKMVNEKKEQKKNRDFMEPSKELEKAMFDLEGMEELTDIDSMWYFINGGGNWIVGS
ncbi:hypothetical protein [Eubacterium aggregans]|uniref:hypothetical protein n=1 Tax=Eubacterium aggregans TaxID=81409 RepID=UPI003F327096